MRPFGSNMLAVVVLCAAAARAGPGPDDGCGLPQWESTWSMAGSLYAYCIGQCAIKWLQTHTKYGRFAGVVGIDHCESSWSFQTSGHTSCVFWLGVVNPYVLPPLPTQSIHYQITDWTHQGVPCVDGQPREFAMQDALAKSIKTSNPGTRVLEYRIGDAVSYDPVVHDKMVTDPSAFVRWHHPPRDNGSICENWDAGAFVDPKRINNPTNNCSYHISSSAYDYTQPAVRQWYLDNIIKPTLTVADGAWLDGDGPDNGAWMCTAGTHGKFYGHNGHPYPNISALNDTEAHEWGVGENLVHVAARKYLIAHKGFEYNCFNFLSTSSLLPVASDNASACSTKVRALNASHSGYRPATVYYGSRVGSGCYSSESVVQAVAVFMLTRHLHDLFHLPHNMSLTEIEAATLLRNDGAPLGAMVETESGIFERKYQNTTVRLNCANLTASFE